MLGRLMSFATALYRKLNGAHPKTKERVKAYLRECLDSGAIPLGIHEDETGTAAYWWLVHDRTRFASSEAMMDYLEARSPRGMKMVALEI